MIKQSEKEKFKKEFILRLVKFSLSIISLCRELKKDPLLWSICDQVIRSATAIGANIVEAQASSSKKDYLKYFEIALKSANETKFWLILIKEENQKAVIKNRTNDLLNEVVEISKVIGSSVLTLKGKK